MTSLSHASEIPRSREPGGMVDDILELQGNRIHYRQRNGPGRSVVFVHGWASSSRMWVRELDAFGSQYRCVALDLPGHGQSSHPPIQWYNLPSFVVVTYELVHTLHAEPVCLVGHSLGGTVAIEYALRYPQEVLGLILVNPVVSGRLRFDLSWLDRRAPRQIIVNLARRVWPPLATGLQRAMAVYRPCRIPDGHRRRNLEDLTQVTADSLLGSADAARTDVSDRLNQVHVPTLVVVGRRDRTVPPEEGQLAASRIPDARLVELPTDHHPGDESPVAFLSALRAHLHRCLEA
jgi:3-oxoadipate enol-lactonase